MTAQERLVASTRDLLWERGYVGTSPKAIQRRAQVGQGSMYHHFAGKPELALAAVRASADELRETADELLSGADPAISRLGRYLLREREVLRGCPMGRLTYDPDVVASPALRAPVADVFAWLRRGVAAVIAEGQASGELSNDVAAEDLAATLVAVIQGGYILARAEGSPDAFERAVRGALALLAAPHP